MNAPRPADTSPAVGFDSAWLLPLAVGLLLRVAYLAGAWTLAPIAGELVYLEQARSLHELGVYGGTQAPGMVALLAVLDWLFADDAVHACRALQVALSVPVAISTMALGRAAFGSSAGRAAGWAHAVYLPLVGYSHGLSPETPFLALFLSGLTLLARFGRRGRKRSRATTLVTAGILVGCSLLFQASGLLLVPFLAVWVFAMSDVQAAHRAVCAAVFAASVAVVLAPWTMRNWSTYQRVVPIGLSVGEAARDGLGTEYTNTDHLEMDVDEVYAEGSYTHRVLLADAPDGWEHSTEPNVADRAYADLFQGVGFALAHPGYFLRTRVLRLADLVAPLSPFVRNYRLRGYGEPVASTTVRRAAVAWHVVSVPALIVLAVLGLARRRTKDGSKALLIGTILYFVCVALVVASSRERAPIAPLLLVCAGGFLAGESVDPSRLARVSQAVVFLLLALLWLVGGPALGVTLDGAF